MVKPESMELAESKRLELRFIFFRSDELFLTVTRLEMMRGNYNNEERLKLIIFIIRISR